MADTGQQFWNEVDDERWAQTFPPWRPTPREQEQLAGIMAPHRHGRAALMGSTPELRDLLSAAQLHVDVVERSASMYRVMSSRCRDTSLETFRESDWLAWFQASADQSYDLIAGDLVIRILPDEVVGPLFAELRRTLRPGGCLCLRMHVMREPGTLEPAELLARYAALRLFDEWIVDRLFFSLSERYFDERGIVDVDAMTAALVATGPGQPLVELFAAKWGNSPLTYHVRDEARLRALAGPGLGPRVLPSQYLVCDTLHVIEWSTPEPTPPANREPP